MAAAAQTVPSLMTIEEYLRTAYHPDCDFVDGRLEERNMGTPKHSLLKMQLGYWFILHQAEWRVRVMSELRTQVSKTRVRLPDVCVVPMECAAAGEIRVTPPLIAIEILSPDDRMNRVIERLDDFLAMGVEHLWLLDPEERTAYTYTANGLKLVKTAELRVGIRRFMSILRSCLRRWTEFMRRVQKQVLRLRRRMTRISGYSMVERRAQGLKPL